MTGNIDLIYVISPLIVTIISLLVLYYFVSKKRLPIVVLAYSFVAYFGAIAIKVVFQALTYPYFMANYGSTLWVLGLYFGLQTMVFEVCLAYIIARFAISRKSITLEHAEGYGAALAFWENGILLGALSFLSLASSYVIIATGPATAVQTVYTTLHSAQPLLFSPINLSAIFTVMLGILERVSSIILHFAWGYLVVAAAYLHKKKYLLIALPMGLIDFFVPYASTVPLWAFEGFLFVIALVALAFALMVRKNIAKSGGLKNNKG